MTRSVNITCPWKAQQIRSVRRQCIAKLDEVLVEQGVKARLQFTMQQIAETQEDPSPDAQLTRFVHIVAALSHHARWGGLSEKQARQLTQVGEAILISHGVEPTTSSLSFVWGELYLSEGQIQRSAGETWRSLWQQHMAHLQSRRSPVCESHFQALIVGNRSLRLGHLDVAIRAFDSALAGNLPTRGREQALISRINAYRLQGESETAKQLSIEAEATGLSDLASLELRWETLCNDAGRTGELQSMVVSVDRQGEFRKAPFMIESFLWTRAVRSKAFEDRVPNMRNLRRITGVQLDDSIAMQAFFHSALQIEQCGESDRPLSQRLEKLGDLIATRDRLPSLDKELLFLAASIRWLLRAKQKGFAATVLSEYRARCRQLSQGRLDDVLGVLSDIDMDASIFGAVEMELKAS